MNRITQQQRYRQALIKYSLKNGVTKAAIKYKTSRQTVYRWLKRYNGKLSSLTDRSHRPNSNPKQHTEKEIKLINDMRKRNPNAGLIVFWIKLKQRGYKRTATGLYRFLRKTGQMATKLKNPKYTPKPYEKMLYPGQRVQIDVKVVPASCLSPEMQERGEKLYQYTAIDEYSRYRCLRAYKDQSSYSSMQFVREVVKAFHFKIKCIQTDNGAEFTKHFCGEKQSLTCFQEELICQNIEHKLIKPFTPRHNGKVERSYRKDNEYFYASHKFYSFEDFKKQLAVHNRKYNQFPMRPLNWKAPADYIDAFIKTGEVF